jgi:endonuclease-3
MADGKTITRLLLQHYPQPKLALHYRSPLQLLIAVMLSAQCTDQRVNEVTRELFRKYKTAADYAHARLTTFEKDIRSTGFYKNKAKNVINCCKQLVAKHHGKVPDDIDALTSLPGVGRKTANMVLGNAFNQPAIAVDTHVSRVSQRLGLTQNRNADKIEQDLMKQIPENKWTDFSNAMILLGRETCTARNPDCCGCTLYKACGWQEKPTC